MASSAIPVLFPPVEIDGEYYIDGGVRQNAPLHPLLYGGAEKIFVISTRAENPTQSNEPLNPTLGLVKENLKCTHTRSYRERWSKSTANQ